MSDSNRSPLVVTIVVVLIIAAVLIAIWLRQLGLINVPGFPKMVPAGLTEAEKLEALSALDPADGQVTSAGLTNAQKQAALDDIPPPGDPANLSNREKQSLLEQLDPK